MAGKLMDRTFLMLMLTALSFGCSGSLNDAPGEERGPEASALRLYPGNSRYLEFRGEPTLLITSAEHYGAVINGDFDYNTYLETLQNEGFNYTRIFGGPYLEPVQNIFGIKKNTLAPAEGSYVAPWVSVNGRYDLNRFNPDYLKRLKDFVKEASRRGIVVEFTFFSSIYAEGAWQLSPFYPENNLNGTGIIDFRRVNTLYNGALLSFQEKYIRWIVRELNQFDNLFFEIQNEPWADNPNLVAYVNQEDSTVFSRDWQKRVEAANGVSQEWQAWVASVIRDEESGLPVKHLIAQNISNFQQRLEILPEHISIINYHYALPAAASENLHLNGVIGLDETGFMPQNDRIYLIQAWRFILSGGGLYNNLDYSFTVDNEGGEWTIPESNPGWGGKGFRGQLSLLARTLRSVPFYDMDILATPIFQEKKAMRQYGLGKKGEVYMVLLEQFDGTALSPDIPGGVYEVTWMDIFSGNSTTHQIEVGAEPFLHPSFDADPVVLILHRINNEKSDNP